MEKKESKGLWQILQEAIQEIPTHRTEYTPDIYNIEDELKKAIEISEQEKKYRNPYKRYSSVKGEQMLQDAIKKWKEHERRKEIGTK